MWRSNPKLWIDAPEPPSPAPLAAIIAVAVASGIAVNWFAFN
jgi:hypothetical protein